MDNRLAGQLQVSGNSITFVQEGNPNDYPYDNVAVFNPVQGVYGSEFPDVRNKQLNDLAGAVEDQSLPPLVVISAAVTAVAFLAVPLLRLGEKMQGEPG